MHTKFFIPVIFFLFYLVLFPESASDGARNGLLLWYNSVIPVLFPFMFISSLLIHFRLLEKIPHCFTWPICKIFRCSQAGSFAVAAGFLCGFPIGAKTAYDLKQNGHITDAEYRYLLCFVNNPSPGFLLSYLAMQMQMPKASFLFLINILGASAIYGILRSTLIHRKQMHSLPDKILFSVREPKVPSENVFSVIDTCIHDTMENSLRLGGYIILFSVISGACRILPGSEYLPFLFLRSSIELTSGIAELSSSIPNFFIRYILVQATAAFGGFSALFQTAGICHMDLPLLLAYTKSRVWITLLSVLISICSLLFCQFFL